LEDVAGRVGYPLFMKPFDGGAWVGVTRITSDNELHTRYDESGERLMHLQESVENFDVFARTLSIGAETMVMNYDPSRSLHERYQISHGFLTPEMGREVITISRLVNAFFLWEFNSCEVIVKGSEAYPIDYANACPDMSLISLHYYFPWAIKTLLKWSLFCAATGRRMAIDPETRRYFDIGDRSDLSYGDKLGKYHLLANEYFDVDTYHEFCSQHLSTLDEVMVEYIESEAFDRLLVDTVRNTFPPREHERFVAHYRGLLGAWASDQHALRSAPHVKGDG
jgi:hypothetical protein